MISVLGAMVFLTGWFALIEFDLLPESERKKLLTKIKTSPAAILLIALMPIGIILNLIGTFMLSVGLMVIGATLIFIQSIIVSLLFWKRKRWKSIVLLITMILLGVIVYLPFFILPV